MNNVVQLHPAATPADLVTAVRDGVEREATRATVRRACNAAIVTAFDLNNPVEAVCHLRDAIAALNALTLSES